MQEVPNWPSRTDASFPHAKIFIDLGTGARQYPLAGLTVRRELQTFLPEQVRAVEGIAAATGEAILAPVEHSDTGDSSSPKRLVTATVPGHWSPFKDLVPVLSGQPVRVTAGLRTEQGEAMPTVLVGEVVQEAGTTSTPELDIELVDNSVLLQEPYDLPAIIGDSLIENSSGELIYSPGVSATWIMADILASAGFDTFPPAGDNTVFQATMLGSAQQNVGGNVSQPGYPFGPTQLPYEASNFTQDGPARFLPAEYAPLGASDLRARYFTTRNVSIDIDPSVESAMVEFWVDFTGSVSDNAEWNIQLTSRPSTTFITPFELNIRVNALTSEVFVSTDTNDRSSMTISRVVQTPGPVRVYVSIEDETFPSYTARITICDSVSCVSDTETGSAGAEGTARHAGQLLVRTADAITGGIRVVDHPGAPEPITFVPETDLDESMNEILATPATGRDTGWEIIQDIAASELGAFWLSETGVATFRNRASLAGIGQPVHEVVAARRFEELRWQVSTNQVYRAVAAAFTPTGVDASSRVVWSAGEQIRVLGNGTRVFDVELEHPTVGVNVRFSANTQRNGLGFDVSSDMQVEQLRQTSATRVSFVIRKLTSGAAWLVDSNGDPDVEVVAWAAIVQDRPVDVVASASPDAHHTLQVPTNDWIQDSQHAADIAHFLASQVAQPVPTIPAAAGKPDARLQLGDIVRLVDPVYTELEHRGLVAGYRNTQTPGRFEQQLTVRLLLDLWADVDTAWNPVTSTNATVRDYETAQTTSTPLTIPAPSTVVGDLLVAIVTVREDHQVTPPDGFELFHEFESDTTVIVRTSVWTKTADSEPGSYDFTTTSDAHMIGGVWAIRGHNPDLAPQIYTTRQPGGWETNRYRIPVVAPVIEKDTAIWWVAGSNFNVGSSEQLQWHIDGGDTITTTPHSTSGLVGSGLYGGPLNRRYPRLGLQPGADVEAIVDGAPSDVDPSADLVLLTNSVYLTWTDFNAHWSGRTWDEFDADPTSAPEET